MWTLRIAVAAVGAASVIGGVTTLACSSSSSPPASSGVDTGTSGDSSSSSADVADSAVVVDAPSDATPFSYSADDLSNFQYSWHGTGVSGAFALDRDCGVTARGQLGFFSSGPDASGVAPAVECASFKALAVSAPVVEAMGRTRSMVCTDDYPSITITLVDGGKLTTVPEQCSTDQPYKTLLPPMDALRKSVTSDAGDGG